jgi:hypothetical protein
MVRNIGIWMLSLALFLSFKALAHTELGEERKPRNLFETEFYILKPSSEDSSVQGNKNIQSPVLAKIDIMTRENELKFMRTFYLGELNVLPYTSGCDSRSSAKSQAYFTFKLPDVCGGVRVRTGLCYHLAENQKNGLGSREQVLYLVSTKTLGESRWKPFVSVSYMRSQVRGAPKAFYGGLAEIKNRCSINYQGPAQKSTYAHYSNVQVLETCCGLQPLEKLSLIFSFNYLKPLDRKGIQLNTSNAKKFETLKILSQSQGVDLKVDYALRENISFLVKSQCLFSNGTLRDKTIDKPIVIEGSLIVSF